MKNENSQGGKSAVCNENDSSRLDYEAPELIAYNPSSITEGGTKKSPGFDKTTGGLGTSYKS